MPLRELAAYAGYTFTAACASLLVQLLTGAWLGACVAQCTACTSNDSCVAIQPSVPISRPADTPQAGAARHTTLCGPMAACAWLFSWCAP